MPETIPLETIPLVFLSKISENIGKMKKQKSKKSQKGYTLIEMMLVLMIITVLAAMSVGSLVNSQRNQIYLNQFEEVLSVLNNTRSLAISGKGAEDKTDADNDSNKTEYISPANYGVQINTTHDTLVIFADLNPNDVDGYSEFEKDNEDPEIRTLNLVDAVTLEAETQDADGAQGENLDSKTFSLYYSPLYVDIAAVGNNLALDKDTPFLVLKVKDADTDARCRQIRIHYLAGIPEVEACN
ncbi:prepilin-type N-terminal cleavage/methylation domain-containing protein [Candidatus Peregrinibacteria bacterium]|nr:prepilin-type N-terminal cleavage/methylation domain-containing protein [Candidatus Peregrinibacteria bacterium]